jgi:hypothetical protein
VAVGYGSVEMISAGLGYVWPHVRCALELSYSTTAVYLVARGVSAVAVHLNQTEQT